MGLLVSVLVSYAGVREAIACYARIRSGVLPDDPPDFSALAERYALELREAAKPSRASRSWVEDGSQGYLCLEEDGTGELVSACVKYYGADSAAILFSSKISSFGQDSVEDDAWGRRDVEKYASSTKTQISQSDRPLCVGQGDRSPSPSRGKVSDGSCPPDDPFACEAASGKQLSWHYDPIDPAPDSPIPEIQFQPHDSDRDHERTPRPDSERDESFLRSPLQRSEASGRRRSFRTRHSSSSPSSRESREEELRALSSLEEAELAASAAPAAAPPDLRSLDEEAEPAPEHKVTDEELDDFWGSSTDW